MSAFANGFIGTCVAVIFCAAVVVFFTAIERAEQLQYDLTACEALAAEVNK